MNTTTQPHALTLFSHDIFGELRVTDRDGAAWFAAPDVCRALEINHAANACTRLRESEKATVVLNDSGNRPYKITIVNESGLYRLIFTSRKKEAELFQDWVFSEVLPTIRKTGSYGTPGLDDALAAAVHALATEVRELRLALAERPAPAACRPALERKAPTDVAVEGIAELTAGKEEPFEVPFYVVADLFAKLGLGGLRPLPYAQRMRNRRGTPSFQAQAGKVLVKHIHNRVFHVHDRDWEIIHKRKRGNAYYELFPVDGAQ